MVVDSSPDICIASYILPRAWEKIRDGKILRSAERELDDHCQRRHVHGRKGVLKGRKSKACLTEARRRGSINDIFLVTAMVNTCSPREQDPVGGD